MAGAGVGLDDLRKVLRRRGRQRGERIGDATGDATSGTSALDLRDEAEELFAQADEMLRQGDLGGYQQTIALAKAKVAEAIDALEG